MINDNLIIKLVRQNELFKDFWPERVLDIKNKLKLIRERSLPGLDNNCLSLIRFKDIKVGDIIVYLRGKNPLFVFEVVNFSNNKLVSKLINIGEGIDFEDFYLQIEVDKYCQEIAESDFKSDNYLFDDWVIKIDARPTINGGPGYYYFFRTPKDLRLSLNGIENLQIINN